MRSSVATGERRFPLHHSFVTAVGLLCFAAQPLAAQTSQPPGPIEEVVVTGSYIKRTDNFETATPVDVMSAADIGERGTPNIGEIIRQQSFNYGVDAVTNIIGATGQSGTFTQANVRGLGARATLTLLNGRRTISGNVQNLYPQIAIDRIETLTDGGTALYGSDAVAAVMNLIPRQGFEGLEVRASHNQTTEEGDWGEQSWGIIAGSSNDSTDIMVAAEWRDRGQLKFTERPRFAEAGISSSDISNPGNFLVPVRDEAGNIVPGAFGELGNRIRDPGCGLVGPTDKLDTRNNPTGLAAFNGIPNVEQCRFEFGEFFNFIAPQNVLQVLTTAEHRFSDYVRFNGEFLFTRQDTNDRGSPQNPGGRVNEVGPIPGEHPGNPFRALNANGNPLFAQDSNGDGLPDRDPDTNQVLLAANPLDPASGVPFNEDVLMANFRPIGKPGAFGPQPTRVNSDGSGEGDFTILSENFRIVGGLEFEVPDTTWSGFVNYVWHRNEFREKERAESLQAIIDGVNGRLRVDGEDVFYNPFATSFFECENRVCDPGRPQTDPSQINSAAIFDAFAQDEEDFTESTLQVVDIVFTGDLFELPAGPLGVAVGGQWRETTVQQSFGPLANAGDLWIGVQKLDWKEDRQTIAAFGEVNIPVFATDTLGILELSAAVRHEDNDDDSSRKLNSEDWKASFRYEIRPFIAIRGSAGTAFIAPDLDDLFEPATFGLSNVADPLFGQAAAFRARTLGGNPDLLAEEADIYNIGLTLRFLEGDLNFSVDWKVFDFDDRIVRPIPTDVVNADFAAFQQAVSQGLVADNIEWALNNDNIDNDPTNAGEDSRIFRDPNTLAIITVDTPLENATQMEWRGLDFSVDYRFDSQQLPFTNAEFGSFGLSLAGTYVDSFEFQAGTLSDSVEAAGKRNDDTGFVPPIPRWRGTFRLGWDFFEGPRSHSMVLLGRYSHHVKEDDDLCELSGFVLAQIGSSLSDCADSIRSQTEWDLQYNLTWDGLFNEGGSTTVSIGAINLFDTLPAPSASLGGLETFLHDPRGRQVYARLTHTL